MPVWIQSWRKAIPIGNSVLPMIGRHKNMCNVCCANMKPRIAESRLSIESKMVIFQRLPTVLLRLPKEISWRCWIMMICCQSMLCYLWLRLFVSSLTPRSFTVTKTNSMTAVSVLILISRVIGIRICSSRKTTSRISESIVALCCNRLVVFA